MEEITEQKGKKCYKSWHILVAFVVGVILAITVLLVSGQFFGATIDIGGFGDQDVPADTTTTEEPRDEFSDYTEPLGEAFENFTEDFSESVDDIQASNEEILEQLLKIKALLLSQE